MNKIKSNKVCTCKECKHWRMKPVISGYGICSLNGTNTTGNYGCEKGEVFEVPIPSRNMALDPSGRDWRCG